MRKTQPQVLEVDKAFLMAFPMCTFETVSNQLTLVFCVAPLAFLVAPLAFHLAFNVAFFAFLVFFAFNVVFHDVPLRPFIPQIIIHSCQNWADRPIAIRLLSFDNYG